MTGTTAGRGHERRLCETHTAVGISADDRAHKLKTPVGLDFVEHDGRPAGRRARARWSPPPVPAAE
ncbi:hypothetical protein GCM10022285_26640 [Streptomyces tunisiensis]|uniref:Uncharacterized protein n=1 Tax=Streptomyces tunisiensis TaxID=948699 RepID=A0ABP7YCP9_9ACTN